MFHPKPKLTPSMASKAKRFNFEFPLGHRETIDGEENISSSDESPVKLSQVARGVQTEELKSEESDEEEKEVISSQGMTRR